MAEHEGKGQKNHDEGDRKHRPRQKDSQPSFEQFHAWEQGIASATETPFRPRREQHAELLATASSDEHRADLVKHLQQTYGNKYMQRLIESRTVQAKLSVSNPNDIYEQEADKVAKAVSSQAQRQAEPEEEEGAPL